MDRQLSTAQQWGDVRKYLCTHVLNVPEATHAKIAVDELVWLVGKSGERRSGPQKSKGS